MKPSTAFSEVFGKDVSTSVFSPRIGAPSISTKTFSSENATLLLSHADRDEVIGSFKDFERIRTMLTPDSIERIKEETKNALEMEKQEAAQKRIELRQSSQAKIFEEAKKAFESIERIREFMNPEEFELISKNALDTVREENMQKALRIRYEKLKTNVATISESKKKMDAIFTSHRDEFVGSREDTEPERKRTRKMSSSPISPVKSAGAGGSDF